MAQNNSVSLFGEVINVIARDGTVMFKLRVARNYAHDRSLGFDKFDCVLIGDRRCELFKQHVSDHDFVMVKGHLETPDRGYEHNKIIVEQFAKGYHRGIAGDVE